MQLTDRVSVLCGLYLDFGAVRSCVDGMKTAGVRTTDISMVLPDGSIMSAGLASRTPRSFEGNDEAPQNSHMHYTARVISSSSELARTLSILGIPAYDSERLESKIRNGGILVSVRCNRLLAERVKEVFFQTDALDISFARHDDVPCLQNYPARREQTYTPTEGWQQQVASA